MPNLTKLVLADEFYDFMVERDLIRQKRAAGWAQPWTQDPILAKFKFTNVKRAHDHTTRKMAEIYKRNVSAPTPEHRRAIMFNCLAYRFFGTHEMAEAIGWTPEECLDKLDQTAVRTQLRDLAEDRMRKKEKVFTAAYIVPNCGLSKPKVEIVSDVLIWFLNSNRFAADDNQLWQSPWSWEQMCTALCLIPGVGSFMAKEVVLDYIMALQFGLPSGWLPSDWQTWTPVGPGARKGAARVLHGKLERPLSEPAALEVIHHLYELRHKLWAKEESAIIPGGEPALGWKSCRFKGFPALDLTDIQFQLCEFDKYQRALTGEGKPKALFKPRPQEAAAAADVPAT